MKKTLKILKSIFIPNFKVPTSDLIDFASNGKVTEIINEFKMIDLGNYTQIEVPIQILTTLTEKSPSNFNVQEIETLFTLFRKKGYHVNVALYNCLISVYIMKNDIKGAVKVLSKMDLDGIVPNHETFSLLFPFYFKMKSSEGFEAVLTYFRKNNTYPNGTIIYNLWEFYSSYNNLEKILEIFEMYVINNERISKGDLRLVIKGFSFINDEKLVDDLFERIIQEKEFSLNDLSHIYSFMILHYHRKNQIEKGIQKYLEMRDREIPICKESFNQVFSLLKAQTKNYHYLEEFYEEAKKSQIQFDKVTFKIIMDNEETRKDFEKTMYYIKEMCIYQVLLSPKLEICIYHSLQFYDLPQRKYLIEFLFKNFEISTENRERFEEILLQ